MMCQNGVEQAQATTFETEQDENRIRPDIFQTDGKKNIWM